jgi:nicotinamidase-related amidase
MTGNSHEKIAIVVVDLVNDFVSGKFGSPRAEEVVRHAADFLRDALGKPMIVFTLDTHIRGDPEFKVWGEHCLMDTNASELAPELRDISGFRIRKRHYDSFYDSDLDGLLRSKGVTKVFLMGISTDICVLHTCSGAFFRNYRISVISDLCASLDGGRHIKALDDMKLLYGAKITDARHALEEIKEN